MSKLIRILWWTSLIALAGLVVLLQVVSPGERFAVGPDDPPPGVEGEWSPDVIGLLVSADLADDYVYPSVARTASGWRLIGPAVLHFADGSEYEMPADTPLWESCFTLDGTPGGARPRHCAVQLGLAADAASISWIKVIGESRSTKEGIPVRKSAVTLINFDRIDESSGLVFGRGGDVYLLAPDWVQSRVWSIDDTRSGHPVWATFDWETGFITRLEPVAFEG